MPLGIRGPRRFPRRGRGGGLFREREGPNPEVREPQSGQPQQTWRDCTGFRSTVRGWLLSREGHGRPGYTASGPGGSLKSLAADRSFLMCLSSAMPASRRQVWDREGTWLSALKPASERALVYMGRPMETSQSDTDATHPGDRGFLQISVSPPLGICGEKATSGRLHRRRELPLGWLRDGTARRRCQETSKSTLRTVLKTVKDFYGATSRRFQKEYWARLKPQLRV